MNNIFSIILFLLFFIIKNKIHISLIHIYNIEKYKIINNHQNKNGINLKKINNININNTIHIIKNIQFLNFIN